MGKIKKWGVIPYRLPEGGGVEVMLISTKGKKWGLPKGNMIRRIGPFRTALVEAFEEAGVAGKVSKETIKCRYKNTRLILYPMLVTKIYSSWPEETKRSRKWVELTEATKMIGSKELRGALENIEPVSLPTQAL